MKPLTVAIVIFLLIWTPLSKAQQIADPTAKLILARHHVKRHHAHKHGKHKSGRHSSRA